MTPEQIRVSAHIAAAEQLAFASPPIGLDPLRRLVRSLLLDELAEYRRAARFPLNHEHAERRPAFIDTHGTRCAMAHLLELGGEHDLVARIARERNHAYVRELADEPRLLAWLAAAGLTVAEAAAIQPSYDYVESDCICGGDWFHVPYPVPADGVLDTSIIATGTSEIRGRVDVVHGDGDGFSVGAEVLLVNLLVVETPVGSRVLVPVGGATGLDAGRADVPILPALGRIDADGLYRCSPTGHPHDIPAGEVIIAVQSSNCAATLSAYDPVWGRTTREGDGDSCAAAAGGSPTSLGILVAIAGALLVRRLRRRQSEPTP